MAKEQLGGLEAFKALRPQFPDHLSPFETSDFLLLILIAYSPSRAHAKMVLSFMAAQLERQPKSVFEPERSN